MATAGNIGYGGRRRRLFGSGYAIRRANRQRDLRPGRLGVSSDGASRIGIDRHEREPARRYVGDRTGLDRRHQGVDDRGRDQP
jgi:hypothetical protein